MFTSLGPLTLWKNLFAQGKPEKNGTGVSKKDKVSNYEWIIQTLQEKCCNQSVNRSHIVPKVIGLKPANRTAESCLPAFDQIQILISQIVSAGHDLRRNCEPWCGVKSSWCNFFTTCLDQFCHQAIPKIAKQSVIS